MACRSGRKAWADAAGELAGDPRSWVLAVVGLGLFAGGIAKGGSLGTTLVVLGVSVFVLGVLLPLVTDAEVGPEGLKLRKALRDWDAEFEPFIRAEHDSLFRFTALLTQSPPEQVEAFVKDAFARAYVHRTGVTSSSLSRYLLCTLVQIVLGAKELRLLADRSALGLDDWTAETSGSALASIPLLPRAIVLLRHQQGLAVGEIAALVGRPAQAVENALRRAETTLQAQRGER